MSAVFIHLKSESADDYYMVLDGPLTDEQAIAQAKAECYEDDEYLYVEAVVRWPADLNEIKGP